MYYGGDTTVTCYNNSNNAETICPKDSNGNFLTMDETSKVLIDNHIWNVGAVENGLSNDTPAFYKAERGTVNGKICSTSGNWCNDTVTRTTTWTGYIGLPYVTDYAYASSENDCNTKIDHSSTYKCKNNNWMHYGSTYNDSTWYLSPHAYPVSASNVWRVFGVGKVVSFNAAYPLSVFPTIYLKSNVIIESGTGTNTDPYILKAGV